MNKLLLIGIISCICVITSCVNNHSSSNNGHIISEKVDTLQIEKFAYNFLKRNSDLAKNSMTRSAATKDFREEFKKKVDSDSLLMGLPVTLRTLSDRDGIVTAHFWSSHNSLSRDLIAPFKQVSFDFCVKVPKDVALTLVEKKDYLINVKYVSHIESISAFQYMIGYDDWVLTEDFELKPNDNYGSKQDYDIDLGLMLVDFLSIEPYEKTAY